MRNTRNMVFEASLYPCCSDTLSEGECTGTAKRLGACDPGSFGLDDEVLIFIGDYEYGDWPGYMGGIHGALHGERSVLVQLKLLSYS